MEHYPKWANALLSIDCDLLLKHMNEAADLLMRDPKRFLDKARFVEYLLELDSKGKELASP